jgi:hypothetical protein
VPTRKQRRRRAKDRRHEYEYVYVDDEGNELEVDADEVKAEQAASRNGRAKPNARAVAATGRPAIQPPSWRRVGKRGLIFAPLMFLTVMFTSGDATLLQQIAMTAWLLAIFLPFSYFMDSFMYRRYVKRTGVEPTKR